MGEPLIDRMCSIFREIASAEEVDADPEWVYIRFSVYDETYPLVVDVVASTTDDPTRITYMLPGGGLNFRADFFTPRDHNLAHFLRRRGHLVVGIIPRDDALAAPGDDPVAADWGLAKRKRDNHQIIALVNQGLRMPYDLLGHSAGGVQALDYAATYPRGLGGVMVLDTTGPYDPVTEPALARRARETTAHFQDMLRTSRRRSVSTMDPGLKAMVAAAVTDPTGTAPTALRPDGTPFTNAGTAHYALIRTAELPGPINWIYEQGLSAGTYTWGATAADDRFTLDQTPLSVWAEAVARIGSGLFVTAQLRDLTAVLADDPSIYAIDWARIRAPVTWVNMALGRGDHPRGAELIRAGGNRDVRFTVVPGYGHADSVWGLRAQDEVWPLLVRDSGPPARAGAQDTSERPATRRRPPPGR